MRTFNRGNTDLMEAVTGWLGAEGALGLDWMAVREGDNGVAGGYWQDVHAGGRYAVSEQALDKVVEVVVMG
jgi:hypothetical protein